MQSISGGSSWSSTKVVCGYELVLLNQSAAIFGYDSSEYLCYGAEESDWAVGLGDFIVQLSWFA